MADGGSSCDKAYFLYRYALEHGHRFNLALRTTLDDSNYRIACRINSDH